MHRQNDTDFRINKVPLHLADQILKFLESQSISARRVPQKIVCFATSLPRDLDEKTVLKLLRDSLCCQSLELTLWSRGMNIGDSSNGMAKLYLPLEHFGTCDQIFQRHLSEGNTFVLHLPNVNSINIRKWVDKRRHSSGAVARSSKPYSPSESFSNVVSKNLPIPNNLSDRLKQFENNIKTYDTSIALLQNDLEKNTATLDNIENGALPKIINAVEKNSKNVQFMLARQKSSEAALQKISQQLALLIHNNNNNNNFRNENFDIFSNFDSHSKPSPVSSTLENLKVNDMREALSEVKNGTLVNSPSALMKSKLPGVGKNKNSANRSKPPLSRRNSKVKASPVNCLAENLDIESQL